MTGSEQHHDEDIVVDDQNDPVVSALHLCWGSGKMSILSKLFRVRD